MRLQNPFAFCQHCRVADKCCTQLVNSSLLTPPVLTPAEVGRIRLRFNCDSGLYVDTAHTINGKTAVTMRTKRDGSCIFYSSNHCNIYDIRPFDCMIFPLDIVRIAGHYCWILYNTFCGKNIEHTSILAYGESLLAKQPCGFIKNFAWDVERIPNKLEYKVLKEIL